MHRSLLSLLLVTATCWAGCSSDRSGLGDGKTPDFGDLDGGVDGGCGGVSCSRDLRSVLDCSGRVVKECGADQACGRGECVAPCDAAARNEGSVGCTFAVPGTNNEDYQRGSCYAFFVANNWTEPANVHLRFKGEEKSLDGALWVPSLEGGEVKHKKLEGPIPAGGAAVVFVSNEDSQSTDWIACPPGVTPVFDKENAVRGTGIGSAVTVSADVPVSMYSIFPYGGASSVMPGATLLFPSTSFRRNYILVSAWGGQSDGFGRGLLPNSNPHSSQYGRPTIQIVATEDDTSIDLLPRVDVIGSSSVAPAPRGKVTSYKLKSGEVLQLTQDNELVGSVIESNRPVGVFGGQTCMFVPSDVGFCDIENNQIPPVSAWGHEYAVLPTPNRTALATQGKENERDPSVVRFVGAADGTELVYEPAQPFGAPDTLASGQLSAFFTTDPFVVRSQDARHPFYVAAVMTGAAATSSALGDPEVAMAVPTDQYLDSYVFFSDHTYTLSSIFVTRRKVDGAFRDVTLDCAGALTGWKPITVDYEWTFAELTRNGEPQVYPAGTCTDGPHRVHSEGPFGLTVWGLGYYASYAYPGGAGLRPITELHVPVQ